MIQFILLFIVFFLLQPINLIVGLFCRLMYHPPKLNHKFSEYKSINTLQKPIYDLYIEAYDKMNIRSLKNCQDFGKFGSMLYWATEKEDLWQMVMSLVDVEHKTFHRYPPEYVKESEWGFSGDQLAGFMGALTKRIEKEGLTDEEKTNLSIVWENCSFSGWPMLIPHYVKGKNFDRGFIWTPWNFWGSSSLIKMMTWCLLGHKITGKIKYKIIYYLTYILFLPTLLISSIDGQIFIKKIYAMSANASHSAMLDIVNGYVLNKSWINKYLMKRIYKARKDWSPDCLALWGKYFNTLTIEEDRLVKNLIYSTFKKFSNDIEYDAEYISLLKKPHKEPGFSEILLPEYRNSDYTDERNFILKDWAWGKKKPEETLYDVIFPAGIYLSIM